jgi:hypothetical protein
MLFKNHTPKHDRGSLILPTSVILPPLFIHYLPSLLMQKFMNQTSQNVHVPCVDRGF